MFTKIYAADLSASKAIEQLRRNIAGLAELNTQMIREYNKIPGITTSIQTSIDTISDAWKELQRP